MAQALTFAFDKVSGKYMAETTVTADFNIAVQFPEAAVLEIHQRTHGGSSFDLYKKYNVCMRPFYFDKDFDLLVYPKVMRVISNVQPLSGHVKISDESGASSQQLSFIQSQINEMRGDNDSESAQTTEIDNNKEVQQFLSGFTNDMTLQKVIEDAHTLSPDQEAAIRDIIK